MSASDLEEEDASAANGCQDFHNALNEFRHQNVFCDVTIYGDNDESNEEEIFAHSIVLAAGSEVLKDTLTLRESNIFQQKYGFIIKIDSITSSIWKLLLDFLYLRRLAVQLSPTVLKDLYLAAKVLGIRNLVSSLGSLITSMEIEVDTEKNMDEVNVKLSPRIGVQERAIQVEDLDPEVEEEDVSPRKKKKGKVGRPRKRRAAEDEEYDEEVADENGLDDDDGEFSPSRPKAARKKTTQKVRRRVKSRNNHVDIKREKESPEKEQKEFKCLRVGCGKIFENCQTLFQHHFTCLMADTSYKVQEYAMKDEEDRLVYTDPFMIDDTGMIEMFATEIERPPGEKGKGTWYQCGHCERQDQGNRMVLHLAFVHGKRRPLHCKECDMKYRDMRSFVDHYMQEHTPVVFTCVHCYQSFDNRNKLKRHVTDVHVNMGQPTHECRGCGKMFKYAGHARRHETYHRPIEERRVHPCPFCGKKFLSKADLQKHELTHQTEKPYKCQQCNYSTALKSNLTLHERTHGIITANYMCITCGRYYLYQHSFQNHIESMGHEGKHVNDLTKEETERLMNFDADEEYEDIPAEGEGLEQLGDLALEAAHLQQQQQQHQQQQDDYSQLPEELQQQIEYAQQMQQFQQQSEYAQQPDFTQQSAFTQQTDYSQQPDFTQHPEYHQQTQQYQQVTYQQPTDPIQTHPQQATTTLPLDQALPDGSQAFEIHFEANQGDGLDGGQQSSLDQAQLEQLISQNIQQAWTSGAQTGQSVVYAVVE